VAAGTSIQSLLAQMRDDAVSASNTALDSTSRAALNADFKTNLAQIQQAIASADVGGVNLIDGSVSGAANVSAATLTGVNLSLGGPLIGVGADASQLGSAIGNVGQAVDQISAQGQAIDSHLSLLAQAGLSLSPAVAGAVNTGLDSDGARLAALQVQQQLSLAGGGIANQSPNAILSLFQAT
jgi:flagellin